MRIEAEQYGGVCSCGAEHQMATQLCVIESDALVRFESYLEEVSAQSCRRCVVYDRNTYCAQGLRRPRADQEIVLDPEGLHANEISTAQVLAELEPDIRLLVAVGGGTVHDIVRYCAKQREVPFVSVPTAASCDGFCSNVAAMTWEGYKNTMPCVAPLLVVADLTVISRAPAFLTASGVGDMLGKYTALADWQISHLVTGEVVCEKIFSIMQNAVQCVWEHSPETLQGSLEAYEAVIYGLLMSGLAIQLLGTSRPASGGEHHISHLIETEPAALGVHSPALHGEKVGVGTIMASAEYRRMAQVEDIAPHVVPYRPIDQSWLKEFFGDALYEVARRENEKDCLAAVTPQAIVRAWPEIRRVVEQIPPAEDIDRLLQTLGAKRTLEDLEVPQSLHQTLLDTSPLIRNRLTLMRMRRMIRV